MTLEEEVAEKFTRNPDWKKLPYDYAYMCIAYNLTFQQAYSGFRRHLSPEKVMFEADDFSSEDIKRWGEIR